MQVSLTSRQPLIYKRGHCIAMGVCIHTQDPLVRQAAMEQYRCRSAFKLIEIDDKHLIFRKGTIVVSTRDLYCL